LAQALGRTRAYLTQLPEYIVMMRLSAVVLLSTCIPSLALRSSREGTSTWPSHNFINTPCLVVVADFNKPEEVGKIAEKVQNTTACSLYVVSKGSCPNLDTFPSALCVEVPNLGEDCATASHFVAHHYDGLPENMLFIDSSFNWGREQVLERMLADVQTKAANHFFCSLMYRGTIGGQKDFALDGHYSSGHGGDKELVSTASPKPLGNWVLEHTDFDDYDLSAPVCAHLTFRTTRDLLLQRPQSLYTNISQQLEQAVHPEAGHYCERMVGALFAGKQKWWTDADFHLRKADVNDDVESSAEWEFDM